MKNMFFNYDNNIDTSLYNKESNCHCNHCVKDFSIVTDIKGNFLGINTKFQHPISLYFHLEDFGSEYLAFTGYSLADLVLSSKIVFEIRTLTHKPVITKEFLAQDCFSSSTNDLFIYLDDIKDLKQESYRMSLKLVWEDETYELFSETDGLLIVR